MSKHNALIHSFNSGEVSKAGLARVDQDKVALCAEVQENLMPFTVGKAIMRPGTQYLGTCQNKIYGLMNYPPRLIPYVRSIDTEALLEITYVAGAVNEGCLRVWRNDELITFPSADSVPGATLASVLTGDATATISGNSFVAQAPSKGSVAVIKEHVTTASPNVEHALLIQVTKGEVEFRCGTTDGADEYIGSTVLTEGGHILSFTPTGSYWIRFSITSTTEVLVEVSLYNYLSTPELNLMAPWVGGNLRGIRYDISLDVVFLVIPSSAPFQIERRGDRSWSITRYKSLNGPFMTSRSNTQVRLKPSATGGNITLYADNPFFNAYHLDAMFKLTHSQFNITCGIAAQGETSPEWRQSGIKTASVDDRAFSVEVSGTWADAGGAQLNIQRSYSGQYSGFENYGADIFGNGTFVISGSADDNNSLVWYRVYCTLYNGGYAHFSITYGGYSGSGICRVTGITNPYQVSAEVIEPFTDVAYTDDWLEGEWSGNNGFPTAVALYDGRLWWARGDRFWGSVSDDYYNFDTTLSGDSAAIARAVATGGGYSDIRWILPLQRLIFGTSGSEASARASSFDEPLKATAITVKDASNFGVADVTPLKLDGRGIFVHRSGRKLLEMAYSASANDYGVTDLMRYNEDIGTSLQGLRISDLVDDDLIEIAVQRHPETWIWCLRDDGVVPVLFYNPNQEGLGWTKFLSGQSYAGSDLQFLQNDKVGSIAVLPGAIEDSVYFIIQRRLYDPNNMALELPVSYYSYTLEKLTRFQDSVYKVIHDPTTNSVDTYNGLYQLDSWKTGVVSASGQISGMEHLAISFVMVIGPRYDAAGSITGYGPLPYGPDLTPPPPFEDMMTYIYECDVMGNVRLQGGWDRNLIGSTVTVGLPYLGRYKSAKLAYGAQQGTALLQKKKVGQIGLLLMDYNPLGVQVGSDFNDPEAMDDLPALEDGAPVTVDSTLVDELDGDMFPFPGVYDTDSRVCIKVKPGYSATLNALVVGVETNEK